MHPGEVFVYQRPTISCRGYVHRPEPQTLVVLDKIFEIDFWTGTKTALGDVMPGRDFTVLS
jgi:hypothetical protein